MTAGILTLVTLSLLFHVAGSSNFASAGFLHQHPPHSALRVAGGFHFLRLRGGEALTKEGPEPPPRDSDESFHGPIPLTEEDSEEAAERCTY